MSVEGLGTEEIAVGYGKFLFFAAKLRCNGVNAEYTGRNTSYGAVTDDPRIGGDSGHIHINHSFYHQLRTEKYALDHPEYYAMLRPEYEGRKGGAGRQP